MHGGLQLICLIQTSLLYTCILMDSRNTPHSEDIAKKASKICCHAIVVWLLVFAIPTNSLETQFHMSWVVVLLVVSMIIGNMMTILNQIFNKIAKRARLRKLLKPMTHSKTFIARVAETQAPQSEPQIGKLKNSRRKRKKERIKMKEVAVQVDIADYTQKNKDIPRNSPVDQMVRLRKK